MPSCETVPTQHCLRASSGTTAAAMTIDNDIAVQDVDYRALKAALERDGQRLVWDDKSVRKPAKTLPGLVTDDTDP